MFKYKDADTSIEFELLTPFLHDFNENGEGNDSYICEED